MSSSAPSQPTQDAAARREGAIAGLLGAVTVALFYLGADLIDGHPLITPSVLGEVFILRNASPSTVVPNSAAVLAYTAIHLVAFMAFGLFLTALIRRSETSGLARYATVQLLVVFELFFYGVLYVANVTVRGMFPLWSVLTANTLAVLVMGRYLWRHHPALREAWRSVPLGGG